MSLIPDWMRQKIVLSDLVAAVPEAKLRQARQNYDGAPSPCIPALTYTEQRFDWIVLHDHCKIGQIDPKFLRRMKATDLEYLAGAPVPADYSGNPEALKLSANVTRATRELQRRYANRTGASIAILGASVGVALTSVATIAF